MVMVLFKKFLKLFEKILKSFLKCETILLDDSEEK